MNVIIYRPALFMINYNLLLYEFFEFFKFMYIFCVLLYFFFKAVMHLLRYRCGLLLPWFPFFPLPKKFPLFWGSHNAFYIWNSNLSGWVPSIALLPLILFRVKWMLLLFLTAAMYASFQLAYFLVICKSPSRLDYG